MSEHRKTKPKSAADLSDYQERVETAKTIVTPARVNKLVNKLVDDGIIPEDVDEHDFSTVAKNIGKLLYYDCVKEEPETVDKVGYDFGKIANKIAMGILREQIL